MTPLDLCVIGMQGGRKQMKRAGKEESIGGGARRCSIEVNHVLLQVAPTKRSPTAHVSP